MQLHAAPKTQEAEGHQSFSLETFYMRKHKRQSGKDAEQHRSAQQQGVEKSLALC